MAALGIGVYDVEQDFWVLDPDRVLGHLILRYADTLGAAALAALAHAHATEALRIQILGHFAEGINP
jgi:hypothetical protein